MLFKDENKNFMNEEFSDREYAMLDFELIEDEIDIDSIEKLDKNGTFINGKVNDQKIIDIQNKINELDLYELETIILQIVKNELRHIEVLGLILGFFIGIVQGIITIFI